MKPKLLIIELWGVGDLAIATPFLRKACEQFDVTLLAKPFALDLQPRFWPTVRVIPFNAPWTAFAFSRKYNLFRWPSRAMYSVWRNIWREHFDVALSALLGPALTICSSNSPAPKAASVSPALAAAYFSRIRSRRRTTGNITTRIGASSPSA